MDTSLLSDVLDRWLTSNPRKLELAAAARDVECLLRQAPSNPAGLQREGVPIALFRDAQSLAGFLRGSAARKLQRFVDVGQVVSPYAGGFTCEEAPEIGINVSAARRVSCIKIMTLNPGRSGLAALGTNELLQWRFQAIGVVLQGQDSLQAASYLAIFSTAGLVSRPYPGVLSEF